MIKSKYLYSTVEELAPYLSSREIVHKCNFYARQAEKHAYDFSGYTVKTVGSGRKERRVCSYPLFSAESVLSRYLSKQIKKKTGMRFSSKTQMINDIVEKLSAIGENDDITLIRTDFVSFYESVNTKDVFDTCILPCSDRFRPCEYEMLETYCRAVDKCYPGLPLSPLLSELPLFYFEKRIKENPKIIALYRYVDDMFFIVKGKWEKDDFLEQLKVYIKKAFPNSPVRLHDEPDKFSCLYLKDVKEATPPINFLFRDFTLFRKDGVFKLQIDIDVFRRKMMENKLREFIEAYKADGDGNKLKYRLAVYSSFCVFENEIYKSRLSYIEWYPPFLYFDLMKNPALSGDVTTDFLMGCIPSLIKEYGLENDPFLRSAEKTLLWNGQSFLFVRPRGLSRKEVIAMLRELDAGADVNNKDYASLVLSFMEKLRA